MNDSSGAMTSSPGAVSPSAVKPVVWWIAGGLGLVGAGALAGALVSGPKTAEPVSVAAPVAAETKAAQNPHANKIPPARTPNGTAPVASVEVCSHCGTVESVVAQKHKGEGTGLGAVGGAVLGGVVGHQVGGGNGKTVATVLGAVGGGLAGHEVEKQVRATTEYQVKLRMDDGSVRTLTHASAPAVGARFEVQGNQLKPLPAKG